MNAKRNIQKSAMARVRELLTAPPLASGLGRAYRVYDIKDLRSLYAGSFTPTRPPVYAFVIAGRVRPGDDGRQFPLIMVDTLVTYAPYELGNENGGQAVIDIHVVGRSGGERDDLADLFAKNMRRTLEVRDYSSGEAGRFVENILVGDEVRTWDEELDQEALRAAGSYDYWEVVRLTADFLVS